MAKRDFTPAEFADRRKRLQTAAQGRGLEWLILFHPVSIHWLTGFEGKGFQAFQCLIVAVDAGQLHMIARESERAEFESDAVFDELSTWGGPEGGDPIATLGLLAQRLNIKAGRVGMEVPAFYLDPNHYVRLKAMFEGAIVDEPTRLVHDLAMVKSPAEIQYIRSASAIADRTVDALRRGLCAGRTELEVAAEIYSEMFRSGGGFPPTAVNFVSGERAAFSHGAPTDRLLKLGDTGNAEYCVSYKRYAVSIGRQFAIGRPSSRIVQISDVIKRAGDACIAAIRDGVAAGIPYEAARGVIFDAGFDAFRVHVTGYALAPGFPPAAAAPLALAAGSTQTLKAGMILSVCPNIFVADEHIGVRIVDNVLVTETGAERLSALPRDLIVVN